MSQARQAFVELTLALLVLRFQEPALGRHFLGLPGQFQGAGAAFFFQGGPLSVHLLGEAFDLGPPGGVRFPPGHYFEPLRFQFPFFVLDLGRGPADRFIKPGQAVAPLPVVVVQLLADAGQFLADILDLLLAVGDLGGLGLDLLPAAGQLLAGLV